MKDSDPFYTIDIPVECVHPLLWFAPISSDQLLFAPISSDWLKIILWNLSQQVNLAIYLILIQQIVPNIT